MNNIWKLVNLVAALMLSTLVAAMLWSWYVDQNIAAGMMMAVMTICFGAIYATGAWLYSMGVFPAPERWWTIKPDNMVVDGEGRTWTADGSWEPGQPLSSWTFARTEKARFGWWVHRTDRFETTDPSTFKVLYR